MLVAWVAAGLGVLTKGLIAALIPAAVLALYSVCTGNLTPWRRLHSSLGLPVFLAITVPWFWLAARREPDFLNFFFVREHLARYLTPDADREESWWFFGAVFLAGSLPWTLSALRVLGSGWRARALPGEFNPSLFLWIWVVFVLVFFSVSDSKLIPYVLPAMPALALLIASLPSPALRQDLRLTALLTVIAALCLGAASFELPRLIAASDRSGYFLLLAKPLRQVAAVLAISGVYVLAQRRHGSTRAAVFLGAGWCLTWLLLMRSASAVSPLYSGIGLAEALSAAERELPIYSVATYDQTLPFYLRRTVSLVAYRGELDYGLQHDSTAKIATVAQFVDRWSKETRAFAVLEITMFDDFKIQGVPMREVSRNVHRVLVARQ
jgi:4-amino-4-deoxy-L-arabinose transferase-like glycosyltransferase